MSSLLLRAKKLSKNTNLKNRTISYQEVYNIETKDKVIANFKQNTDTNDQLLIIVNAYEWNSI